MSKTDRTIAYYSIYLSEKQTGDMYEEEKVSVVINNLLGFLGTNGSLKSRKVEKKPDNKIYYLESINSDEKLDNVKYLVFVSAKYNHVTELINKDTLEEKKSNKTNDDGDKEYTHLGFLINDTEVILAHEQRINGTPKSIIEKYLLKAFKDYLKQNKLDVDYTLSIDIIPDKNFVEELANLKRVNMATLVIAKRKAGLKAFQRFAGRGSIQKNVSLTFKSEKSESISTQDILEAYNSRKEEDVNRIVVYGFNESGRVRLDTEPIKTIKKISVKLNDNGIVNKESIFEEYNKIFKGMK